MRNVKRKILLKHRWCMMSHGAVVTDVVYVYLSLKVYKSTTKVVVLNFFFHNYFIHGYLRHSLTRLQYASSAKEFKGKKPSHILFSIALLSSPAIWFYSRLRTICVKTKTTRKLLSSRSSWIFPRCASKIFK